MMEVVLRIDGKEYVVEKVQCYHNYEYKHEVKKLSVFNGWLVSECRIGLLIFKLKEGG